MSFSISAKGSPDEVRAELRASADSVQGQPARIVGMMGAAVSLFDAALGGLKPTHKVTASFAGHFSGEVAGVDDSAGGSTATLSLKIE